MEFSNIKSANDKEDVRFILEYFKEDFESLRTDAVDISKLAEKAFTYANVYKYEDDGVLKGFVIFYSNDLNEQNAYISLIAVKENFRGEKIGSMLIDFSETHSMNAGMKKMRLEVKKVNTTAISFYEKKGYKKESENSDSIYMIKRLGDKNENQCNTFLNA